MTHVRIGSAITKQTTSLEDATTQLEHAGETVGGIDISGSTATLCLLPTSAPLRPCWITLKGRTPDLEGARQIGLQIAEVTRSPATNGTTAIWIEQPYGQLSSVGALMRTAGALAAGINPTIPVDLISANEWRRILGIRLGKGAKERAQAWAHAQLVTGLAGTAVEVLRDHNAADSYGIAYSILVSRAAYQKENQ